MLGEVARSLLKLLPGTHSSIRLLDETRSNLVAGARAGQGSDDEAVTFQKGQGIIGWVAQHGKAARVADCSQDPRFVTSPVQGFAVRSLLAVPLLSSGEVIGVLAVSSPEPNAYNSRARAARETGRELRLARAREGAPRAPRPHRPSHGRLQPALSHAPPFGGVRACPTHGRTAEPAADRPRSLQADQP